MTVFAYPAKTQVGELELRPYEAITSRHEPLTTAEKRTITQQASWLFNDALQKKELAFLISATNLWLTRREVLTDPIDISLKLIKELFSLNFGPSLFLSSGGDIKNVDLGIKVARRLSPERDMPYMALFQRDNKIYIGQYTYRNAFAAQEHLSVTGGSKILSVHKTRPVSLIPVEAINELEELISQVNPREAVIQKFLENHSEILESLGYASVYSHVALRSDDQVLIPDFLLVKPGNQGFDILDLKKPSGRVLIRDPFLRVSHEILKALAQLRTYRKYFDKPENRSQFYKQYGLEAFTPELIVIIGRHCEFKSVADSVEAKAQLQGLRIMTYDDLLSYGKSRSVNFMGQIE
jgi:hypothetical protein